METDDKETEHSPAVIRVPFQRLCETMCRCLILRGFTQDRGARCAAIIAENSLVGVPSHGVNRFLRFIEGIERGWVDPRSSPHRLGSHGALEQWDGRLGPGPLNAEFAMQRALEIASAQGVGCVGLRNTNHWLRAGTYAWQAAQAGSLGLCFTNTEPNLPPWGSTEAKLGNNPIAVAVPRADGRHVMFDGAMSQFSYGALETAILEGRQLPVPGGFDRLGAITTDPNEIISSRRPLPIGYWKGSGLALVLDLVSALVSGGQSSAMIGQQEAEYGVSQVFLAFGTQILTVRTRAVVEETLHDLCRAQTDDGRHVTYPGERIAERRQTNMRTGVPVSAQVWGEITRLASQGEVAG